jgi:hypothetical protein
MKWGKHFLLPNLPFLRIIFTAKRLTNRSPQHFPGFSTLVYPDCPVATALGTANTSNEMIFL